MWSMRLATLLASFFLLVTAVIAAPANDDRLPIAFATRTTPSTARSMCENPSPVETTGYPDYDAYCQCPPYDADTPAYGNPYLGLVKCETRCSPANPTQTLVRPENDSLASCMNACTGSFEKMKRDREAGLVSRQGDDYWFCHAVNFVPGELCEFIGELGEKAFEAGGPDCWQGNH
ncbi:hypothetical protein F4778DRAFT_729858 [Xylariomycetidae sp. FL2044]|nr:hypothetical protein F4778DRAFT_729858 [Xylariomycetidae sp. FL2044]